MFPLIVLASISCEKSSKSGMLLKWRRSWHRQSNQRHYRRQGDWLWFLPQAQNGGLLNACNANMYIQPVASQQTVQSVGSISGEPRDQLKKDQRAVLPVPLLLYPWKRYPFHQWRRECEAISVSFWRKATACFAPTNTAWSFMQLLCHQNVTLLTSTLTSESRDAEPVQESLKLSANKFERYNGDSASRKCWVLPGSENEPLVSFVCIIISRSLVHFCNCNFCILVFFTTLSGSTLLLRLCLRLKWSPREKKNTCKLSELNLRRLYHLVGLQYWSLTFWSFSTHRVKGIKGLEDRKSVV